MENTTFKTLPEHISHLVSVMNERFQDATQAGRDSDAALRDVLVERQKDLDAKRDAEIEKERRIFAHICQVLGVEAKLPSLAEELDDCQDFRPSCVQDKDSSEKVLGQL